MLPAYGELRYKIDEAIDHAASEHHLQRLDADANLVYTPCPEVLKFAQWTHKTRRGLLAFAIDRRSPNLSGTPDDLDAFDRQTQPQIPTRKVFDLLASARAVSDTTHETYLQQLVNQERELDTDVPADQEARAFAAMHFQHHAVSASLAEVQVFAGGTQGLFHAFLSAVSSQDEQVNAEDILLAQVGIPLPWRDMTRGSIRVVDDLASAPLADWLAGHDTTGPRALYVPLVNTLTGQVLTRRRAHDIALTVLQHNQKHPDKPLFVFADDSAINSCHTDLIDFDAQPIGAVTGPDLGESSLGKMTDWTISVASPHITLATSRIAFAVTHNKWLRKSVEHWSTVYGHLSRSRLDELIAAAALSLTPGHWLYDAKDHVAHNLQALREAALSINASILGFDGLAVSDHTAAGWHTTLHFHPRLFPHASSSVDVFTTLLLHDHPRHTTTRIALAPGELFSWSYQPNALEPWFVLRVNLSVPTNELKTFLLQLEAVLSTAWETAREAERTSPRSVNAHPAR